MPRLDKARKAELKALRKRFRVALIMADLTAEQWAIREGITPGHLSHTLAGRRSDKLTVRIEAFITEHLPSDVIVAA